MSIKDIITVPNEILKKISEPIEKIGTNEKKLVKDLFETMYNSKGIGLAAVQVGILKRILVIDVSNKDEKREPLSFINPVIKKVSDELNSIFISVNQCCSTYKRDSLVSFKRDNKNTDSFKEEIKNYFQEVEKISVKANKTVEGFILFDLSLIHI